MDQKGIAVASMIMQAARKVCARWSVRLLVGGLLARFGCAAILFTAAVLKTYQLFTDPSLGVLHGSRWFEAFLIESELLLVAWLLSGYSAVWCRRIVLAAFSGFACYSLYQVGSGAASCNCFGAFKINPSKTSLLDLACLWAAWAWKPRAVRACNSMTRIPVTMALALLPIIGAVALLAVSAVIPIPARNGITQSGTTIFLEPAKWIGRPLPLFEQIDIGSQLADGKWLVVLYHHDCPKCREILPSYEQIAKDAIRRPDVYRVALIEVPPHGSASKSDISVCAQGRLDSTHDWFVETPVAIQLSHGEVMVVRSGNDLLEP